MRSFKLQTAKVWHFINNKTLPASFKITWKNKLKQWSCDRAILGKTAHSWTFRTRLRHATSPTNHYSKTSPLINNLTITIHHPWSTSSHPSLHWTHQTIPEFIQASSWIKWLTSSPKLLCLRTQCCTKNFSSNNNRWLQNILTKWRNQVSMQRANCLHTSSLAQSNPKEVNLTPLQATRNGKRRTILWLVWMGSCRRWGNRLKILIIQKLVQKMGWVMEVSVT